ncbi:CLUMA_CG012373, isoform A [Clunio marinus]|uniref:CLUMA_CG012373, isoform A n=1 Tax=Clunio marinus TaxID=568069 RepID=A0A1J1IHW4_9DIPT|nr:CLUMA_CG012373, isoform A [Clunio marinus]
MIHISQMIKDKHYHSSLLLLLSSNDEKVEQLPVKCCKNFISENEFVLNTCRHEGSNEKLTSNCKRKEVGLKLRANIQILKCSRHRRSVNSCFELLSLSSGQDTERTALNIAKLKSFTIISVLKIKGMKFLLYFIAYKLLTDTNNSREVLMKSWPLAQRQLCFNYLHFHLILNNFHTLGFDIEH